VLTRFITARVRRCRRATYVATMYKSNFFFLAWFVLIDKLGGLVMVVHHHAPRLIFSLIFFL
jgi:hypothetical protein